MKRTSTTKTPARSDDAPKLRQADLDRATFRVKGKAVAKPVWQEAVQRQLGKKRISIMLDAAIVEHFKAAGGERGYQTLINETLRRAMTGESFVSEMRNVLRQELAEYKRGGK